MVLGTAPMDVWEVSMYPQRVMDDIRIASMHVKDHWKRVLVS
jgi:hypothetical protein